MGASGAMIDQGYGAQPGAAMCGNVAFIPPGLEGLYKESFTYTIFFANLLAGSTQVGTSQINNDSYFVVVKRTAQIWDQATGNTTNTNPALAPMRVKLLDTSSGKYSNDIATPLANLFGTAQQPAVELYRAHVFLPGGQIQAELTNNMAAAQQVFLTFEGFKVYNVPDALKN